VARNHRPLDFWVVKAKGDYLVVAGLLVQDAKVNRTF
jgi:hypothetical protein